MFHKSHGSPVRNGGKARRVHKSCGHVGKCRCASQPKVRGRKHGFTLLELMLVVTVLSIVVVMAIPGMTGSRKHANEASTISSLRTISTAQIQYRTRFGSYAQVNDLMTTGYVDNSFSDAEKAGYQFTSGSAADPVAWDLSAQPINPGVTGDRWFFVDHSGVVRFRDGAPASSSDQAVD